MDKKLAATLAGAVAAAALLAPGIAAAQGQVNIYNWNDYIGETTLQDFTAATGVATNYDVYDNLEILEQKLMVGNSGYDVTVPTAEPTMSKLIQAGALQKLDKSKIPNWKNLDETLMRQVAERTDPGNEYGAIYAWGTIGLGINPDKIRELAPDAPLDSFDLIFDPKWAEKLAPCGITILDSATDTIPTVLNYLGLDPNSEKPEDLQRVEETLMAIRPHVKNFVTGQTINDLAAGDSCVALAYSGDVIQAQARAEEVGSNVSVEYVTPKEGVQLWFDMLTVPAGAPNADAAHAFINFVLDPKVMAGITDYVNYGNAVPASLEMIDEAVSSNPAVFPPAAARERMFTVQAVSPQADRLRTRSWTRVKTGQ
ncbi:polyamine ABC transporter substrate-binding protein [Arenibaculum sp.]|uniref:polyamine ABC transporter substrate-binding protein n=1 Tax=Arenibaculum sp. TaxID=2865862 RepID=UPI002E0FC176|nr:polyamine ABC transporter substrate-binding protein [Arenibaculum sp.]